MPRFSRTSWKSALTKIIEELNNSEYKKMLEYLDKVPKYLKTPKNRVEMPQIIIKHYGEEKSVFKIRSVMAELPRRDAAIQDLLRPFVDKLRDKKKGTKRTFEDKKQETPSVKKKPRTGAAKEILESAAGWKKNFIRDSDKEPEDPQSLQSDKERKIPTWRNSIQHLKISANSKEKPIVGKVVRKSALRPYQTKTKEKKSFFYLGVADETDIVKVMVYGSERYPMFEEGHYYLFRDVIVEERVMKVTQKTKVSKTTKFDVPNHLEVAAQMLIYPESPRYSVAEAKKVEEKTLVSVEGTVTEINPIKPVNLKGKRSKKNTLRFKLEDQTDDIEVTLWGDDTKQFTGTSVGDVTRVTNVKTSHYFGTVSLNSTDFTRIIKVQHAAVQNVSMEIIGIREAGKDTTELDAQINSQVNSFVVDSPLLAKVFGVRLGDDFEARLLEKIPFRAGAEIQGNKIKRLKAQKDVK